MYFFFDKTILLDNKMKIQKNKMGEWEWRKITQKRNRGEVYV